MRRPRSLHDGELHGVSSFCECESRLHTYQGPERAALHPADQWEERYTSIWWNCHLLQPACWRQTKGHNSPIPASPPRPSRNHDVGYGTTRTLLKAYHFLLPRQHEPLFSPGCGCEQNCSPQAPSKSLLPLRVCDSITVAKFFFFLFLPFSLIPSAESPRPALD